MGCTFDHRIADAYSFNMFMVRWAQMAHSDSKPLLARLPSFRRSVVDPRRPSSTSTIHPSIDRMYIPVTALPDPNPSAEIDKDHQLTSRIYYVKAHQLELLQKAASSSPGGRTKLESFSAFLWKMVAKCHGCQDGQKPMLCRMGIVVDGRKRLSAEGMESYFGNVLSIPFGSIRADDLIRSPLDWVARQVHDFVRAAATEDHFLGLIDWVEAHRPVPGLAKIYASGAQDGPAFVVSSGQGFPVSEVDFGWGRPAFGSYHFPWGGDAGYVMPMPSPAGNGDWVVYMHLSKNQLDLIENEASRVFTPFDFHRHLHLHASF